MSGWVGAHGRGGAIQTRGVSLTAKAIRWMPNSWGADARILGEWEANIQGTSSAFQAGPVTILGVPSVDRGRREGVSVPLPLWTCVW